MLENKMSQKVLVKEKHILEQDTLFYWLRQGNIEKNVCPFFLLEFTLTLLGNLQARLQQYMNCELPHDQAGFRKGRGTRDQIANVYWIMEKAREFQKNIYFCFIDYAKAFDCVDHNQFISVPQLCLTLCDPMNHSTPSLPVHHQLQEFTQTHVHRVGDAIQPSHPLSSPSPPAPNTSQHQSLFQWVNSSHEVAKILEFQLQHQSLQWTPRTDLL